MVIKEPDSLPTIEDDAHVEIHAGEALPESLWRVRLKLGWAGFRRNWRLFRENGIGMLGLVIIGFFLLMAVSYPILTTVGPWQDSTVYDPVTGFDPIFQDFEVVATQADVVDPTTQMDANTAQLWCFGAVPGEICEKTGHPAPPQQGHILGTDPLGRDIASQLTFSTRAAFMLGLLAAVVTVVVATTVGSIAAFYGGWLDNFLMRLADLVLLMPLIPILIVLSGLWTITRPRLGVLGPSVSSNRQ